MDFPGDAVEAKSVRVNDFPGEPLKLIHGKSVGALGIHRGSVEREKASFHQFSFNASTVIYQIIAENYRGNSQIGPENWRNY
jgi:hypothetical protein